MNAGNQVVETAVEFVREYGYGLHTMQDSRSDLAAGSMRCHNAHRINAGWR